ncbi:tRNA N6-adenosine threonylcarbamoyltransferase [Frankliniella fusca]|uniref:tRNA N6-adenosine threonylcarbamoyltransferase n=1 Tax=Frankliniella fusca TaxID=407009 RepID=A0AAE1HWV2_9NEOP|nr:tRNA N6-adenosine threonylcarbamoyltransferase [Frankliniella fusca]
MPASYSALDILEIVTFGQMAAFGQWSPMIVKPQHSAYLERGWWECKHFHLRTWQRQYQLSNLRGLNESLIVAYIIMSSNGFIHPLTYNFVMSEASDFILRQHPALGPCLRWGSFMKHKFYNTVTLVLADATSAVYKSMIICGRLCESVREPMAAVLSGLIVIWWQSPVVQSKLQSSLMLSILDMLFGPLLRSHPWGASCKRSITREQPLLGKLSIQLSQSLAFSADGPSVGSPQRAYGLHTGPPATQLLIPKNPQPQVPVFRKSKRLMHCRDSMCLFPLVKVTIVDLRNPAPTVEPSRTVGSTATKVTMLKGTSYAWDQHQFIIMDAAKRDQELLSVDEVHNVDDRNHLVQRCRKHSSMPSE